jgi:NAD-dependent dihydropyrimidine dehydrogenase PreA subunit
LSSKEENRLARRQIIRIDEAKCTGCGECITACAEGALEIIDGKARLVGEVYCDGLGACLGNCPEGALTIEEREAEAFDEEAVRDRLASQWASGGSGTEAVASCPSTQVLEFGERPASAPAGESEEAGSVPLLGHWPVKLRLVPPDAPFLRGADVMLVADCVGFAWRDLRREVTPENAVLIGCPKFDEYGFALDRLTQILREAEVRSLAVVHMEVPCCAGYWHLAREACAAAGGEVPLQQVVVGVRGEVKQAGQTPVRLVRIEPLGE